LRQEWDNGILRELWVDLQAVAVMVVVNYHHNLRLRRVGYCETEGEHESKQNSFHNTISRSANPITEQLLLLRAFLKASIS
jgi:hypothetical protein